jgi:hypothetical protein
LWDTAASETCNILTELGRSQSARSNSMWIGHGQANQWPASDFHANLKQTLAEDKAWARRNRMTMAEFRAAYLLTLLGVISPAGTG